MIPTIKLKINGDEKSFNLNQSNNSSLVWSLDVPEVNNNQITIKVGLTTKTFKLNQSNDKTLTFRGGIELNSSNSGNIICENQTGMHEQLQLSSSGIRGGFIFSENFASRTSTSIDSMAFSMQRTVTNDPTEFDSDVIHSTGIWSDIEGKTYLGAHNTSKNGWFFSFDPSEGTSKVRTLESGVSNAQPVALSADGTVYRCTSVRADKKNIVDLEDRDVDSILDQLRPVVYEDVNPQFGFEGDTYIGLIAEDVYDIDPRLTVNDYKYEFT